MQGCECEGVGPGESCPECFLKSKANIGKWKGIRDDLLFLLDEDLSHVNLCALHCELRNTEQLLKELGLFAYECNSLMECNKILSEYGPQNMKRDRISVKLKPGQESTIRKHNITMCSFSGSTERRYLENIAEIVEKSLPLEKLSKYYFDISAAEGYILSKITFTQEMIEVHNM
ncbi:hypothetical protein QZH41_019333 [Actinostola sp. cb2023]|nr:hypothetical protein QZH41_019333 [Actinostola sp. cb2023]